jgi:hypothetical protein
LALAIQRRDGKSVSGKNFYTVSFMPVLCNGKGKLVYGLYGLTEEKTKIVEGQWRKNI